MTLPQDAGSPPVEVADGWAEPHELIAWSASGEQVVVLEPAPRERSWIPATQSGSARWCLPLLMANMAGWVVRNPVGLTAVWDGGAALESVTVTYDGGASSSPAPARSLFGTGILSFEIPYLFRTAPGFDLLVRGPANSPKDAISPLEGLVATDWAVMPFTMNWQLTRPGQPVRFEVDEPVCMLVPQRREDLTSIRPRHARLGDAPETAGLLAKALGARRRLRQRNLLNSLGYDDPTDMSGLERQYFRGRYPDGRDAPDHRARVKLRRFALPD